METTRILRDVEYNGKINDFNIIDVTYDSRRVVSGSLFIAIVGQNVDGHDFIDEALLNGASLIIVNRKLKKEFPVPVVQVKNTRVAMSKIADNFYNNPSSKLNTIGITGTNGKTTTTFIINKILNDNGLITGSIGTLGFISNSEIINTGFTTPESIELQNLLDKLVKGGIKNVVMEVSSHALALHRMNDVDINTAIFTNLSNEHLDFHGNMENYFNEKAKLFNNLSSNDYSVLNYDDEYSKKIIDKTNSKIITYGFNKEADIFPTKIDMGITSMHFELSIFNEKHRFISSIIGNHNIYNLMAAIGASIINNISIEDIAESIKSIDAVPGRLEFIGNKSKKVFIDYAHTPDAYKNIFSLINQIKDKNKIITIFGCGGDRDKDKRSVMAKISESYSDYIIVTTDNPRTEDVDEINKDILKGFQGNEYEVIQDRSEAIKKGIQIMDKDTILLILGKGREEYQLIGDYKFDYSDVDTVNRELDES